MTNNKLIGYGSVGVIFGVGLVAISSSVLIISKLIILSSIGCIGYGMWRGFNKELKEEV